MKKILLGIVAGATTLLYANVNAVVSILPQKTFVQAIGGDKVHIALMVQPGNEPHSYEPKPSQMRDIAKADVYFSIGVEFEKAWLPRFANQNGEMKIVNLAQGIQKIAMVAEHHHDGEKENALDPHIWTSPQNVKIIAENIYHYLTKNDAKNRIYYKQNYEKFLRHIDETNATIHTILAKIPAGTQFMIFHPAWGYFARDYRLKQLAIEAGGKNPKPKEMIDLINEAKAKKVKAIFTAPEFSDKAAKQIAKEVGVPVVKISPLNPKWSENLIQFAHAIAHD